MKLRPFLLGLAFVSGLMLQITGQNEPPEVATAVTSVPAVIIRGSDSMIDMVNKLAQAFHESSFPMPTVTGGGSGVGIASLADATADICTMSRPMKPAERTRIENAGRVVTEIVVAYDAVAVWVHESCPLKAISLDQLRALWMTGDVRTFEALGAKSPAGEIHLIGRPNSSGQYSLFSDLVRGPDARAKILGSITEERTEAAALEAVASDPLAMAYARPAATAKGVKRLDIAPTTGAKPIAATPAFIANGTYPLSRPLYYYTTDADEPGTKDFIAFTKSAAGQKIVEESGFTPLPSNKTAQRSTGCTKCRLITGLLGSAGAALALVAWRVAHARLRRKPS
jgi:phosphate transport system substrate-binding protein